MSVANHFLDSLPNADREDVLAKSTLTELRRDQLLAEAGERVAYAYFPLSCILSVLTVMRDGRQVESRTIGRESGFGLLHALGSRLSFERVLAQVSGQALRTPIDELTRLAARNQATAHSIAAHAQATIAQSAMATACNALHGVEERMCRWLLMTEDRLGAPELPLTQEHLAIMLGVQRTTVTQVAGELQDADLISYARGLIRVRDREGLLERSCECYRAINEAAEQLANNP